MRPVGIIAVATLFAGLLSSADAPDAREIMRRCVQLDQSNWMRMKDYTWTARESTRHLDSAGQLRSVGSERWETVILFGKPYRKTVERDGKPLSPAELQKEQEKIDRAVSQLENESPEQRASRLAKEEKDRAKDREFFSEVPDVFHFRLEGEETIDGRPTWVISATPNLDYQPKHSEAKAFQKIEGRVWVDQREFQWVRIEARTTATISWGLFLARLNPGATLSFEQTRVNDQIWLPSRMLTRGSGRLGLLKKLSEEQEVDWSNYRKFQVESSLVPAQ